MARRQWHGGGGGGGAKDGTRRRLVFSCVTAESQQCELSVTAVKTSLFKHSPHTMYPPYASVSQSNVSIFKQSSGAPTDKSRRILGWGSDDSSRLYMYLVHRLTVSIDDLLETLRRPKSYPKDCRTATAQSPAAAVADMVVVAAAAPSHFLDGFGASDGATPA